MDASEDERLSGEEIFVDVLEKLLKTLAGLRASRLKGDGPAGVSLTGVHIGVLLGTHELPLKLKCIWGDSSGLDNLLAELPKGGSTSFKPFGRGIDPELDGGDCVLFCGEDWGVLSSSNVTQLAGWFIEHIVSVNLCEMNLPFQSSFLVCFNQVHHWGSYNASKLSDIRALFYY